MNTVGCVNLRSLLIQGQAVLRPVHTLQPVQDDRMSDETLIELNIPQRGDGSHLRDHSVALENCSTLNISSKPSRSNDKNRGKENKQPPLYTV